MSLSLYFNTLLCDCVCVALWRERVCVCACENLTHDHDVELEALLHGFPPHLLQDGIDAHVAEIHARLVPTSHQGRGHLGHRHLRHGTAAVAGYDLRPCTWIQREGWRKNGGERERDLSTPGVENLLPSCVNLTLRDSWFREIPTTQESILPNSKLCICARTKEGRTTYRPMRNYWQLRDWLKLVRDRWFPQLPAKYHFLSAYPLANCFQV